MSRKQPWLIIVGVLVFLAGPSQATSLKGTLTIRGKHATGAIISLESAAPMFPSPTPVRVTMDQKNLAFVPEVLPVVRGTIVEFTNSDNVLHNVFSPSAIADEFDLGSYSQGQKRSVALHEVGEVLILCNIHMEMEARILVFKDPYFAVVDQHGGFQISDIPSGVYVVKIWRNHFLKDTRSVTIPADGEATLLLEVEE